MSNERSGTLGKDVNSYGTPVAPDEVRESYIKRNKVSELRRENGKR